MSDTAADSRQWECEAYGTDSTAIGALCFFAAPGRRVCVSERDCANKMSLERQRVFDRIQELSAEHGSIFEGLADEFSSPQQLLGGEG